MSNASYISKLSQYPSLEELKRLIEADLTEAERAELEALLEENPMLADALEGLGWVRDAKDTRKRLRKLQQHALIKLKSELPRDRSKRSKRRSRVQPIKISPYVGAAAAAVIALFAGIYIINSQSDKQKTEQRDSYSPMAQQVPLTDSLDEEQRPDAPITNPSPPTIAAAPSQPSTPSNAASTPIGDRSYKDDAQAQRNPELITEAQSESGEHKDLFGDLGDKNKTESALLAEERKIEHQRRQQAEARRRQELDSQQIEGESLLSDKDFLAEKGTPTQDKGSISEAPSKKSAAVARENGSLLNASSPNAAITHLDPSKNPTGQTLPNQTDPASYEEALKLAKNTYYTKQYAEAVSKLQPFATPYYPSYDEESHWFLIQSYLQLSQQDKAIQDLKLLIAQKGSYKAQAKSLLKKLDR